MNARLALTAGALALVGTLTACAPAASTAPAASPAASTPSPAQPSPATSMDSPGADAASTQEPGPADVVTELTAAAHADAAVGPALDAGDVTVARVSRDQGWARLDISTAADGLIVVLVRTSSGWAVADAGGYGTGCPVAPVTALTDLGLDCG